jgi:uncharacterized membrane protein YbhN (UPF0104 family)
MALFTAMMWLGFFAHGDMSPALIVMLAIYTAIAGTVIHSYWSGKRWARHLVLIASILTLSDPHRWTENASLALSVARIGAAILSFFLLFWLNGREGRTYFGALYREQPQVADPRPNTL